MDLSTRTGETAEQDRESPHVYTAQAATPLVNGEVKLTITDTLTVAALFDVAEVPFVEINALILADSVVTVKTDGGDHLFSKMGSWSQPFYDALCTAYNKAVLRSLFVKDSPILTTKGVCRHSENGVAGEGAARIHVYENSVVSLPPNLSARRAPLCFVSGMEKGTYELTLHLNTGEAYSYAKLGYDTDPFANAVETQIRKLREKSLAAVKELDPSLTAAQASQLAKLMPQGASAPFGQLAAIAPSFPAALESELANTRAADSYQAFKELCDPARIFVGFRKNEGTTDEKSGSPGLPSAIDGTPGSHAETGESTPASPYLLWLIAPSPDGRFAAVEFAEADSATFLYRTGGDFIAFAGKLNRALEAIHFRREAIRIADEELRRPELTDYHMAAKRTAALQFVRANFAGRIIHSGVETWKRKVTELWRETY